MAEQLSGARQSTIQNMSASQMTIPQARPQFLSTASGYEGPIGQYVNDRMMQYVEEYRSGQGTVAGN